MTAAALDTGLRRFVRESNLIEGIHRAPTAAELAAHERLLALPVIRVSDLSYFVAVVAGTHIALRDRPGLDVYITGAEHRPPPGGPDVHDRLRLLLDRVEAGSLTPYEAHVEYETIHPYQDGNGRSGRALWAWQMRRDGDRDPFLLGFLHEFYYQALDGAR